MSPRLSASAPLDGFEKPAANPQRLALSFEVMPPRHDADRARVEQLLTTLDTYEPDYVAVTSSRRSGWLEGTAQFISQIVAFTSMRPLAHLACTAAPAADLQNWINVLVDSGIRGFLALRGDLEPNQTALPAGYLQHADELVRLIRRMESDQATRFAAGRLAVAVACYPNGHAESRDRYQDLDVLLNKQRLGADLGISQLFFHSQDFLRFTQQASLAGVTMPLVPGIMPVTNLQRLRRMGELSGVAIPPELVAALESAPTDHAQYDIGVEWTINLINQLIRGGAKGIHLYTHNNPQVTRDILSSITLPVPHY